jgi:hypothetical protein
MDPASNMDHTDEVARHPSPPPASSNNERRRKTIDKKFSLDEKPDSNVIITELPESQPKSQRSIRDFFSVRTILQCGAILVKFGKFTGPGSIISVAYIDPDNFQTAISSGAQFQFKLLFMILVSNLIAIYLQVSSLELNKSSSK